MKGTIVLASILTGFLGAGKTTILRELLRRPGMERTAVLINEFGEVGLDQHLIGRPVGNQTVLLENGCLCCTLIDDLTTTLRGLYVRQMAGEIPAFDRIVIETTGLADPARPVQILLQDQLLADCYRLDGILTVVDCVAGRNTLAHYAEARKQAAMADRILLTKTDIGTPADRIALEANIRSLNPAAPIVPVLQGDVAVAMFFGAGYFDRETGRADIGRWLAAESYLEGAEPNTVTAHRHHFNAFCLVFETPLSWGNVAAWLKAVIATCGPRMLRIKGLVNVAGQDGPVVIHCVQQMIHPPVILDAWPDEDRRSKIVFIGHEIERVEILALMAPDHARRDAASP